MVILWFRGQDLRLMDQPALHYVASQAEVVPVFILDEALEWSVQGAQRWWLHHSLVSLANSLQKLGSRLIVRQGDSIEQLRQLMSETQATEIVWCRRYEPAHRQLDHQVKKAFPGQCQRFDPALLFPRGRILNQQAQPYKVFTPFWRACMRLGWGCVRFGVPKQMPAVPIGINSLSLDQLALLDSSNNEKNYCDYWQPGELGAQQRLQTFLEQNLYHYANERDDMDKSVGSGLSPHLAFGEISPQQITQAVEQHIAIDSRPGVITGAEKFLSELGWREFSHSVLYYFPNTVREPFNAKFNEFPWHNDEEQLWRWQLGQTGFPIIDAAMRELLATGTMHNRARMVVASFLTKHCGIHWLEGARWFWQQLMDAGLAANTMNWQWVAGCGVDAAPYYRIFNPLTQARKFDAQGDYVRRWVPELADIPGAKIHQPWSLNSSELAQYGVNLGQTYPEPMLDLKTRRERALQIYQALS